MKTVTKPNNRKLAFDIGRLQRYISRVMDDYPHLSQEKLLKAVLNKLQHDEISAESITQVIFTSALEFITIEEPDWTFVAAEAFATKLYKEASLNRGYKAYAEDPYGSYLNLIKTLVDKGIYRPELLDKYTKDELTELDGVITPSRDRLFTYVGLLTLAERYLACDFDNDTLELPQERFMIISQYLLINEDREKRIQLIKEAYWALSNLYMTVATPTLSNSGKAKGGQLSSCFIDTVSDSLRGIYDNNTDIATLSKMGGGIGIYVGKIRSRGSDIRGYKGKSNGVVPWLKQLNNTAVAVDQLGTRSGAVAVYLDIWHRDILSFLDLRLNNGDERMRAHDLFTGVCIPDLFMEAVDNREDWHLFCPHEVRSLMGYSLEDYFDEEVGTGSFRARYAECVANPLLQRVTLPAIDIMKRLMKSQKETGTPYMFYRDTANRANPNKHAGMIYCSNLCTEIMQNMSPTVMESEQLVEIDGKMKIVTTKEPGDFVVCNLSSINLGRAEPDGVLERVIDIQIRMLDSVVDLNNIEVLQAQYTNSQYRAIGLGTFGLHHLFALKGIMWESDYAVTYCDELYERIAYYTIKASNNLAKEKGAYPKFIGSDWHNGNIFVERGYVTRGVNGELEAIEGKGEWLELALDVMKNGVRNGWMECVAPNMSTAIIAGSTPSTDPIYKLMTYEEKTTYKIANPVPDLNAHTIQYYRKNAFMLDQKASIRMAIARQRHIDQSQSFNIYILPETKASVLLELHLAAWGRGKGLKTTYYVKNQALEVEDCESCSS